MNRHGDILPCRYGGDVSVTLPIDSIMYISCVLSSTRETFTTIITTNKLCRVHLVWCSQTQHGTDLLKKKVNCLRKFWDEFIIGKIRQKRIVEECELRFLINVNQKVQTL